MTVVGLIRDGTDETMRQPTGARGACPGPSTSSPLYQLLTIWSEAVTWLQLVVLLKSHYIMGRACSLDGWWHMMAVMAQLSFAANAIRWEWKGQDSLLLGTSHYQKSVDWLVLDLQCVLVDTVVHETATVMVLSSLLWFPTMAGALSVTVRLTFLNGNECS